MVILSNLIRKKVSELPFLAKDDLVENGDDLYFCSSTCYMQFALMHRCPSISEDKVSSRSKISGNLEAISIGNYFPVPETDQVSDSWLWTPLLFPHTNFFSGRNLRESFLSVSRFYCVIVSFSSGTRRRQVRKTKM